MKENNELVQALDSAKSTIGKLKLTLMAAYNHPIFNNIIDTLTPNKQTAIVAVNPVILPQGSENEVIHDIVIPVSVNTMSVIQLQEQLGQAIQLSDNATRKVENQINHSQQISQEIIEMKNNQAIVTFSDSVSKIGTKVLIGSAVLVTGEFLVYLYGSNEARDLLKTINSKLSIPVFLPLTYPIGSIIHVGYNATTGIVKTTLNTAKTMYKQTRKLILQGIMNLAESSTKIPDISTSNLILENLNYVE